MLTFSRAFHYHCYCFPPLLFPPPFLSCSFLPSSFPPFFPSLFLFSSLCPGQLLLAYLKVFFEGGCPLTAECLQEGFQGKGRLPRPVRGAVLGCRLSVHYECGSLGLFQRSLHILPFHSPKVSEHLPEALHLLANPFPVPALGHPGPQQGHIAALPSLSCFLWL